MREGPRLGFDNVPRSAFAVAAILVLTLLYAVLQVGVVRPSLPPGMGPGLARPPASAAASTEALAAWRTSYHAGDAVLKGFTISARTTDRASWIALFLLRPTDSTAALIVLALALSGVAGGGPLLGAERTVPVIGPVLTVFSWLAMPLAFPIIALAILYFP